MTYPDPTSRSAQLFARGRAVMPGGNSRTGVTLNPYPIYAVDGSGCRVTDVDGSVRIDCINNWSSLIHGHGNHAVLAAIAEQSQHLLAVGMPTEVEIDLATLLCERLPGVEHIRFSNSGTEGVMMALRAARAYTGRDMIAKVEGAYHGSADALEISVAPTPAQWGDARTPASVPATAGIPAKVQQDTLVLPFNDVEATSRLIEQHAGELAAVVIDPIVSRMCFVEATDRYVRTVRELTESLGIVLVFDEVFSFRVGYHGAQGVTGVTPDLTALGKVIGGGLPVGATGGKAEIMEVFDQTKKPLRVEHGGTYNANPLTMAAGLACMEQMTPAAYERLDRLGDRMRDGLRRCLDDHEFRGQVTGRGSLAGLIFNDEPFTDFRSLPFGRDEARAIRGLHQYLLNHGVQIIPFGLLILSTAMTEEDIDEILERVSAGMGYLRNTHHADDG
jgi:glutamate-1-semialdehyde 2,1-aminomutase